VRQQHVGKHEALAAGVAGVGALPVVRLPVHPDVPCSRKPLLTDFAGESLLVGVPAAFAHFPTCCPRNTSLFPFVIDARGEQARAFVTLESAQSNASLFLSVIM